MSTDGQVVREGGGLGQEGEGGWAFGRSIDEMLSKPKPNHKHVDWKAREGPQLNASGPCRGEESDIFRKHVTAGGQPGAGCLRKKQAQ